MEEDFESVEYINDNMSLILELAKEANTLHRYLDALGIDDTDKNGNELSLLARVTKYNYLVIPTA
ncbi:MAG: hypothetical protein ACRDD8_09665 [Bacteroidales bacterium]